MKKIYYTHDDLVAQTHEILRQMAVDNWRPDYIVGITRGGLVPAVYMSHYLQVPLHTLSVSLRDSEVSPETNCWMAEDSFGYQTDKKNILIVDDINDSGETLNWIKNDWQNSIPFKSTEPWDKIWNKNTRFAVLINNEASSFKNIDYSAVSINKLEDPCWVVFPFETQY